MIVRKHRGMGVIYGPAQDSWFDTNADAPLSCADMAKAGVDLSGTSCVGAVSSVGGFLSQYGIYIALGLAGAALFAAGGRR